jgi:uncharacterized NTF2-like protein DUF6841
MNQEDAQRWFTAYLAAFEALGRGDVDRRRILDHYGVPLLVSTEHGPMFFADAEQVLGVIGRQLDGMRAEEYARTEELASETTLLNPACAVHRGRFARLRADGTEAARVEATYVITEGEDGPRISALLVHSG